MGCGTSQNQKQTVPIKNSFIHLVQSGRNDLIKQKIINEGKESLNIKLNFRGDTIVHYACFKGNRELVEYFKQLNADFTVRNYNNQTPISMIKNPQIFRILGISQPEVKVSQKQKTVNSQSQKYLADKKSYPITAYSQTLQEVEKVVSEQSNQHQNQQHQQPVAEQNPQRNKIPGNIKGIEAKRQQTYLTRQIKANLEKQKANSRGISFQQD